LAIRDDIGSEELRRRARRDNDGRISARLIAIANALEGMDRASAARLAGMDRQTLRDWVHRYNAKGIAGLCNRPAPGRRPKLSEGQMALSDCFDDGRLALDNNPAERALRCIATKRPLCPSSSSLWKHWNLIFEIGAIRTTFSRERGADPLAIQVAGADLVRGAGHHLLGGEDAILDQAAYPVIGDAELLGGLGHGQPFWCHCPGRFP